MRVGVVRFPGSCDERDALWAVEQVGGTAQIVWHQDEELGDVDAIVIPGGFSYGDYLRCGAIARFAPVMRAVVAHAKAGGPVLGICNGFQVLCEAGLLPGALTRNAGLRFVCRPEKIRLESGRSFVSGAIGDVLDIPVKHGEGRYVVDDATRAAMDANGQIVFRYLDNPNGSVDDIAGVCNEEGNVLGLMPHPEHAVDPATGFGTADGAAIIGGMLKMGTRT